MSTLHDLPVDRMPAAPSPQPTRLRLVPDEPLAFDEAVRRLTPRLQRYVMRRLGDRHEAEELVQEALLRAYQHADQLRTEEDLSAWATVVAGRLVIDRLRVRGRSTSVADVPEGRRTSRDTADVVVARDEARTALDALDAMPPRQAAVLWAREVEGLGYDAIGERYGMTEPAVRSLLSRARKALRREFTVRGGTLPAGGLAALAPWVDGMSWLERLRRLGTRAAAPAAVAVVGVGVLGGALLAPATFADPPAVRPAVVRSQAPVGADSRPAPTSPATTAGRLGSASATLVPAPAGADSPREVPLHRRALDRLDATCVGAAGVGAGGYDCTGRTGDELVVLPLAPLPEPVDLPGDGGAGLELSGPLCDTLPALPLTRCTPEETP